MLTMAEYIEREALRKVMQMATDDPTCPMHIAATVDQYITEAPAADVELVRHGRWILQANNERTNYRWNVTAECSECCDEIKEIWAGFFHNVPDWLARDVALESAKSVKLSNYCPNCGAKMDG